MLSNIWFWVRRQNEKLWLRPILMAAFSVLIVFAAKFADVLPLTSWLPEVERSSLIDLLDIISSSMLMISTFAVGSMVSAFAAASNTATPRSVNLVIADDISQNALSLFIGAFIYSLVALFAIKNSYFDKAGFLSLLIITVTLLALVIIMFLRWVDHIARLGRMGTTIDKVTQATREAMQRRNHAPYLCAVPTHADDRYRYELRTDEIGYVQHLDISDLQSTAEEHDLKLIIHALPGTFCGPDRCLISLDQLPDENLQSCLRKSVHIGDDRLFDEDPRFGLVVLSEIACRALSPAVNDPGTAMVIIGRLVDLFHGFVTEKSDPKPINFDRIKIPALSLEDCFTDAFRPIMRDGAGTLEVMIRMQKAFAGLASMDHDKLEEVSRIFAVEARERGLQTLAFESDKQILNKASDWL